MDHLWAPVSRFSMSQAEWRGPYLSLAFLSGSRHTSYSVIIPSLWQSAMPGPRPRPCRSNSFSLEVDCCDLCETLFPQTILLSHYKHNFTMKSFHSWQLFYVLYSFPRLKRKWPGSQRYPDFCRLFHSFRKKQAAGLDSVLLKYWFSLVIFSHSEIGLCDLLALYSSFPCIRGVHQIIYWLTIHCFSCSSLPFLKGLEDFPPFLICDFY